MNVSSTSTHHFAQPVTALQSIKAAEIKAVPLQNPAIVAASKKPMATNNTGQFVDVSA